MAFPRVSDFSLVSRIARVPLRLHVVAGVSVACTVVYGQFASGALDQTIRASGQAWIVLAVGLTLLVVSSFIVAMSLGAVAFGPEWREQDLVQTTPEIPRNADNYVQRMGDKTGAFYVIFIAVAGLMLLLTQLISGPWVTRFHERGFVLAEYRSRIPTAQIRGLTGVVRYRLDELIGADALRARLQELLESPSPLVRAEAAWAVGRLGVSSLEPRVRALIDDESFEVQVQALHAVGTLATPSGIQRLRAMVADASLDPDLLKQVLVAIGLTRNPDAARGILERLDSLTGELQVYALWAIAESGDVCASPEVLRFASEEFPDETRCAATDALKKIATTEMNEQIRALFQTEDPWCDRVVWYGRSSRSTISDFHRIIVSAERLREKVMDADFNTQVPDTTHWLASIVNDPETNWMDRKHARQLFHLLNNAPNALLEPRTFLGCPEAMLPEAYR